MKQAEVIKELNDLYPNMDKLQESVDPFCSYDAINDTYIVEIKSRERKYNPWLIERAKLIANYDKAIEVGKEFIYLTEHKTKIITWNINDLIASGYNFGWEIKEMPQTTAFEHNEAVLKEVGYLYEQFGRKI